MMLEGSAVTCSSRARIFCESMRLTMRSLRERGVPCMEIECIYRDGFWKEAICIGYKIVADYKW
jgi:hypothetical protein